MKTKEEILDQYWLNSRCESKVLKKEVIKTMSELQKQTEDELMRFAMFCATDVVYEHEYFDIDGNITDNKGNYLYKSIYDVFNYWKQRNQNLKDLQMKILDFA